MAAFAGGSARHGRAWLGPARCPLALLVLAAVACTPPRQELLPATLPATSVVPPELLPAASPSPTPAP